MAFDINLLQPIGGQAKAGTVPQIWSYTAAGTDAIADINTAGYFNDASKLLKVGDLIYIYDASVPTFTLAPVLSNASGVVDIADGTVLAVTDTD